MTNDAERLTEPPERRTMPLELRLTDDSEGVIDGYAAVFNRKSENLGGFVEQIAPGAFAKTIAENPAIVALFNHNPDQVLGSTRNGTLQLEEDKKGLHMRVKMPNTEPGRDVLELIRRGDVVSQSFSFQVIQDDWSLPEEGGQRLRTLKEVRLFDVGPVVFPAYKDTIVSARALSLAITTEPAQDHSAEEEQPTEPAQDHSVEEEVSVKSRSMNVKQWRLAMEAGKQYGEGEEK